MPDYPIPKNAVAYVFYAGLPSQSNPLVFQANPSLSIGDFKVSIDGGALANLTTLPTVTPTGGKMVKFSLSAVEMTGDNITVVCSDVAGSEWCDQVFNIATSVRGIADIAYPTTSGRSIDVDANGGVEVGSFQTGAITAASIDADAITDAKVASDVTIASVTGAVGSVTGVTASDVGAIKAKTDNIPATPASTTNITAATGVVLSGAGVQAIWDALTSARTTAGSIGKRLVDFVTTLVYAAPPAAAPTAVQNRQEMDSNSTQLAKLGSPAGASISADILEANADMDELITTVGVAGAGLTGIPVSTIYGETGSVSYTYTVFDVGGVIPLAGVSVYVSSDVGGVNRSQAKLTDALGRVQFDLIPSTVYFWRSRNDRSFVNPDTENVS